MAHNFSEEGSCFLKDGSSCWILQIMLLFGLSLVRVQVGLLFYPPDFFLARLITIVTIDCDRATWTLTGSSSTLSAPLSNCAQTVVLKAYGLLVHTLLGKLAVPHEPHGNLGFRGASRPVPSNLAFFFFFFISDTSEIKRLFWAIESWPKDSKAESHWSHFGPLNVFVCLFVCLLFPVSIQMPSDIVIWFVRFRLSSHIIVQMTHPYWNACLLWALWLYYSCVNVLKCNSGNKQSIKQSIWTF